MAKTSFPNGGRYRGVPHTLNGECFSLDFNDGAVVEVAGEQSCVYSCRHQHNPERGVGSHHVSQDDQDKVGLEERERNSFKLFEPAFQARTNF